MQMLLALAKASDRSLVSIICPTLYRPIVWREEVTLSRNVLRRRRLDPELNEAIEKAKASYACLESSPLSAAGLAKSLGISSGPSLKSMDPELYAAAVAAHGRYKAELRLAEEQALRDAVSLAFAQGVSTSAVQIARHLKIFFGSEWRMNVLHDELKRLMDSPANGKPCE
ncbi:hypothetical protein [Cupriavidus sp. D384]|uniref:hypothetical protein n=1 Tax=Cupriavidus sp. D384 TaxID=1538095 RepID=UPI001E4F602C|nr:hypothetical protein [Cupriavidus sp. D384]